MWRRAISTGMATSISSLLPAAIQMKTTHLVGSLLAWFGDGHGNFPVKNTIASGLADMQLKVFDINRDGKLDIVNTRRACMDSCAYGVETWLGHGSRTFTYYTAGVSSQSGFTIRTGVTFGDFDRDGILDLATGAGAIIPDCFLMFR